MFRHMVLAVALAGMAAGTAFAQAPRKDAQVRTDAARQVNRYPNLSVFDDISIGVDEGVVTLTGKVTMPYKRTDIERRVAKVTGVEKVENRIEVLPASSFDDDLRYRVARALYGNPSFWKYAAMANPPIHIVVERGRVILTGVVNNNVEKMLARSIASTVSGSFSVENRLRTDAEAAAEREAVPID